MGFTVGLGRGGCVAVGIITGAAVAGSSVDVARLAVWAGAEQAANNKASGRRSQTIEARFILIFPSVKLTINN